MSYVYAYAPCYNVSRKLNPVNEETVVKTKLKGEQMSNYETITLPPISIGGKDLPCDGCCFIKIGRARGALPESKSRTCIAGAEHIKKCVINGEQRTIWQVAE